MFVNISTDRGKYYSQRNNQLKPAIRCKPTATVEALDLAGWSLPFGPYAQPEDNLTAYCERRFGPDAPENWEVIKIAVNEYFNPDSQPVTMRFDWLLPEALFGLIEGKPFATSTWLTKAGHVVNLVGFETSQDQGTIKRWQDIDLEKVSGVIVDDPYGRKVDGAYTDHNGFNCRYGLKEFLQVWRGIGIQVKRKV